MHIRNLQKNLERKTLQCRDFLFKDLPEMLQKKWEAFCLVAVTYLTPYWNQAYAFLYNRWKKWQPKIDQLLHATIAISTATSTLKISIELTPIILSVATVLATAPLLSFILPQFLFEPYVLGPLLLGISCFAGYFKYRELVLRAKLDHQIKENQKQIVKHERQLKVLKKHVHHLENMIPHLKAANMPIKEPLHHPYLLRARKQPHNISQTIIQSKTKKIYKKR